jgi:nucleoside-diphosphate-sugar epimerase
MYGPAGDYEGGHAVPEDFNHKPRTMYGVYKQANEGTARVYWQDQGVVSVGLRMMTVYGVGREVGMTSGPTKAVKSAILGRPSYEVSFKGRTSFNDVRDVARLFIEAAKKATEGAIACGVKGVEDTVEHFMEVAEKVVPELKGRYHIAPKATELPFPSKSTHSTHSQGGHGRCSG